MNALNNYAVLEMQGHVVGTPSYSRKKKNGVLRFAVSPREGLVIPMKARGENAKAFKSLLRSGVLVQIKAIPKQEIMRFRSGTKGRLTEWEAKRIAVLSAKRVRLKPFEDMTVLDGLMPEDGVYEDVGYVEPLSWGRFSARREKFAISEEEGREADD